MSRGRIALLGSRGIPNRYGGFETLMEELAPRLAARGFQVSVYCRSHNTPRSLRRYRGAELVVLPSIRAKYLDTPVHTFLSCLHAAHRGYDAALMVNAANALFLPLLRLASIPVTINVDGLDRNRAKWGPVGRAVYALSERLSIVLSDILITDAAEISSYYRQRYRAASEVIGYGVEPHPLPPGSTLDRLGLEPRRYFLYVSRFEPENNPHRVAEAYRQVGGQLPLVMVGDAPYSGAFVRTFTSGVDPRILFPGGIYGEGYRELLSHALAYIQATEVGGTHPALVEAMGYGNCVLANDTPEHREVLQESGRYFSIERPDTLRALLEEIRQHPESAQEAGRQARDRALSGYSWEGIADHYSEVLDSLLSRRRPGAGGLVR